MICDRLPTTGVDVPLLLVLALAACCVVAGALLLARRPGRRGATLGVLLLALCLAGAVGTGTPAQAATADCITSADGSLTVTQTSTMAGLAPGIAPVAITGVVKNVSTDETFIAAVDVQIMSVVPAATATGPCSADDYTLLATRMPVGTMLQGGASVPFEGASIGFRSTATNQDACQGATIRLLYTVVPR